jgi:hypothetical protein
MWAATFPMEVILYALVEAALKQRRTAGITNEQLSAFAYVVMRRKWREQQRCEGVAICDLYKAVAA